MKCQNKKDTFWAALSSTDHAGLRYWKVGSTHWAWERQMTTYLGPTDENFWGKPYKR